MKKYLKYFSLLLVGILLTGCAFLEGEKNYKANDVFGLLTCL
jgi:PBP1b-binding outer membrane lipoprotein LpoB